LIPHDEGYALARQAAEKVLAIDPNNGSVYTYFAWTAMADGDLKQAARHLERALHLDPTDTDVIGNAALLLRRLCRLDKAIAVTKYCIARDPLTPLGHGNLAGAYLAAGRWDDAIASYQSVLRLSPNHTGAHCGLGRALFFKGEAEAALAEFALVKDESFLLKGTAMALHDLGRQETYEAKLQELIDRWGDEWPVEVAHVYAQYLVMQMPLLTGWTGHFKSMERSMLAGSSFFPNTHRFTTTRAGCFSCSLRVIPPSSLPPSISKWPCPDSLGRRSLSKRFTDLYSGGDYSDKFRTADGV